VFAYFVREERRVDAAEYDERASRSGGLANLGHRSEPGSQRQARTAIVV
jgi:hypothetical protein